MANIRLSPEVNVTLPETPGHAGYTPSEPVASSTLGTQIKVPELLALQKPTPTAGESVVNTLHQSLTARMIRGMNYMTIPDEAGFDVKKALGDRIREFDPDELVSLYDARSSKELDERIWDLEQARKDNQNMAAHPATALASSLLDIDLAIGGVVGAMGKASRLTRVASSVALTTGALGLASQGGVVTPLEAALWTVGAVAAAIPRVRTATATDNAVKPASDRVTDVVDNIVPVAENAALVPTEEVSRIPTVTTEPQVVDNIVPVRDEYKPDPDYPVKEVAPASPEDTGHIPRYYTSEAGNTYISKPDGDIEMVVGKLPDNAIEVKNFEELFPAVDEVQPTRTFDNTRFDATVSSTTRDAVGAVLKLRDDLPSHLRVLAENLYDSLDMEVPIPIHFQTQLDDVPEGAVGFFKYLLSGPIEARVQTAVAGMPDLTSLVKGMPLEEVLNILHESMHSKIDGTLANLTRIGAMPEPIRKAAQAIVDTFNYVKGHPEFMSDVLKRDPDFNYAFENPREFMAMLFNSPMLVDHLSTVIMPATKKSVFRRILDAVTQIITGHAPVEQTAMDKVESSLNVLFHNKTYWDIPQDIRKMRMVKEQARSSFMKKLPVGDMYEGVSGALNGVFSGYEALANLGPAFKTIADKLLVDSTGTSANSAAHYARAALLQGNVGHMRVQSRIAQAMVQEGWNILKRFFHPVQYRRAFEKMSNDVYEGIAENARRFNDGLEIIPHQNANIEKVLRDFEDSGWADGWLDNIKASGVEGAQDIQRNPWYLPREHNYNKIAQFLRENSDVTAADIEGMYTDQFKRMFADQGIDDSTAKKLGRQMLKNMQNRSMGNTDWRSGIAGMGMDEIREALESAGIEPERVQAFLGDVKIAGTEENKVRNLKHRLEFDMTMPYRTKSGKIISPNLFINKDVSHLMEGYGRRMAGRVGLAKAGYPDLKSLDADVSNALANVNGDARTARELIDNNIKHLLGMPTGERVPDFFRSINILSSATNLAMSGVFQLADTMLMVHEYGIARTLKAIRATSFGRDALTLARSPEYGKRLQDVLEGRLVLSGMYRPVLTHLDDNFDLGHMSEFNRMVQHWGQNTRFASGLEFVRRGQVKLFASLIGDTLNGAIAGNAGDLKILQRYGLTDELLERIRTNHAANPDASTWGASTLLDTQAMLINAADGVVLENRLGDIAPWMQFSTLGKVVLPYLSFVSGAWNKILRRRMKLDGITGVMMAMAYQMPAATLSAAAAMELKGQEIDPVKLATKSLTQTPIMSWFGYAVDFATQGPTNSIAALSIADKMYSATKSVMQGKPDAQAIVGSMPWISLIPGVKLYAATIAEADAKKTKKEGK